MSRIPKPLNLTGPLEVNNLLDNTERLFEGQVHGPETLLKRDNEIYASIHGGEVIKLSGDHITHVAKFGKPCGTVENVQFHEYANWIGHSKSKYIIPLFFLHSIHILCMSRRFDRGVSMWQTIRHGIRYNW